MGIAIHIQIDHKEVNERTVELALDDINFFRAIDKNI